MCDFGQKLYLFRRQLGMSVNDLAAKTGMAWTSIVELELNQRFPSINELERLLAALKTDWKIFTSTSI